MSTEKRKEMIVHVHNAVRVVAGVMVLVSLALGHWVGPYWLFLTAFVGVNLIQSAFTGFCPAEMLLKRFGVKGCSCDSKS